ncbi:MAG TPA: iron-containing alcohol dehydrogenase [Polyangiaceae bacterium]|nr:iron-containing alcohol dehydrogenase [Polyangiaceae bacterium]
MMPAGDTFELATAQRVIFGRGSSGRLAELAAELGDRVLVVSGKSARHAAPLEAALTGRGLAAGRFRVTGEPTTEDARRGVAAARELGANVVIGIGGGSAIDAGKAIAALLSNPGDPIDYLEVVGKGQSLTAPSVPYLAVPTTAGTGAEVTRNAVLEAPEHHVKVSLRSPLMLPRIALVDPQLTLDVPPEVTAATGFDALAQVIEPFVSHKASPLTDPYCLDGMRRSARSLRAAFVDGSDLDAREDLCLTSLFGGLALANAKLGAVHGFAGPLGGMYGGPHGALCAALLPDVMRVNLAALRARAPHHPSLERYAVVARTLTGNPSARAEDGIDWVRALAEALAVPKLRAYGVAPEAFGEIAQKARRASSMQGNPIPLTDEELHEVLAAAT